MKHKMIKAETLRDLVEAATRLPCASSIAVKMVDDNNGNVTHSVIVVPRRMFHELEGTLKGLDFEVKDSDFE